jgi:hypothetical protein
MGASSTRCETSRHPLAQPAQTAPDPKPSTKAIAVNCSRGQTHRIGRTENPAGTANLVPHMEKSSAWPLPRKRLFLGAIFDSPAFRLSAVSVTTWDDAERPVGPWTRGWRGISTFITVIHRSTHILKQVRTKQTDGFTLVELMVVSYHCRLRDRHPELLKFRRAPSRAKQNRT